AARTCESFSMKQLNVYALLRAHYRGTSKWMDKPPSRAVGISYQCPKQCCNVLEGTRHITAHAIVMTAAAKLTVAAAQLARLATMSEDMEIITLTASGIEIQSFI
ncbi:hypothetical protein Tco_1130955, partial [Tanacetum coccineum]